jgi:hypothetical protein
MMAFMFRGSMCAQGLYMPASCRATPSWKTETPLVEQLYYALAARRWVNGK